MTGEFGLHNYMLELVNTMLPKFLRDNAEKYGEIVTRPEIIVKIKENALNILPPMYITTKAGEVYGEYNTREMQKQADITMAFSKAVDLVLLQEKNI